MSDNTDFLFSRGMTMTTITLEVDTDVAKAFQLSEPEQQKKFRF